MNHFLYILRSKIKETYYTGISKNPEDRLFFHNNSDRKKHTLRYRPWKLVYTYGFETKEEALAAESKVKSWKSKKMIRLLIEGEVNIGKMIFWIPSEKNAELTIRRINTVV